MRYNCCGLAGLCLLLLMNFGILEVFPTKTETVLSVRELRGKSRSVCFHVW